MSRSSKCGWNMKPVPFISDLSKRLNRKEVRNGCAIGLVAFITILSFGNKRSLHEKYSARSIRNLYPNDRVKRTFSSADAISRTDFIVLITRQYEPAYNYTGNYGNMIWQYAAGEIIPDFSKSVVCSDYAECKKMAREASRNTKVLIYRPVANTFNDYYPNLLKAQTTAMETDGNVVFLLGGGVQLEFFNDTKLADINPGHPINSGVNDFQFTEQAKKFLSALNARKVPATFRGDFTWKAAKLAGYDYGVSLGCPSLLINPSITLGQTLAKKYFALKQRIGDRSLRIALNVQWFQSPRAMDMSYRILREYPNSVVYAQNLTEATHVYENGIPFHRVRLFGYVDDWIKSLETMDVSLGVRIHGNMAALAAGIPVLVIAPDHRVLELVQRMRIPHITGADERLATNFDVAELVTSPGFDDDAFDLNRCATARTYENIFAHFGLRVKEQISIIGNSC